MINEENYFVYNDGTQDIKVKPEHKDIFLERFPNAKLIKDLEGNQQSSSIDATTEQSTQASSQETSRSRSNTDSSSEIISSDSQLVKSRAPRTGVKKNEDGSESTHLMKREVVDGKWVVFPSLFQEKDGSWNDMSNDQDWMKTYNEAKNRGEVFYFGEDEDAAVKFADKGAWKTDPKHAWLNYEDLKTGDAPLFTLEEEDAVVQLRNKYPGFKFEQANISPTISSEESGFSISDPLGSYNAIEVSYGDNKQKFKVGLSTDDAKRYEESYNQLVSFIDKHSTSEDDKAELNQRAENIQAYKDFNANVKYTEDQEVELKKKYLDNPNLFKPTVEESVSSSFRLPIMGGGYSPATTVTKKTIPYEEELELAKETLINNGIEEPTIKQVEDLAREILLDNELRAIVEKNTTKALEQLKDIPKSAQQAVSPLSILNLNSNTAPRQKLALGAKELEIKYNSKISTIQALDLELKQGELLSDIKSEHKKLNDKNYEYKIVEGEDLVKLDNGKVVPSRVIEKYNSNLKDYNYKIDQINKLQKDVVENSYNIESTPSQMDLLKRNYNSFEERIVETGVGFAEMGAQVGYGAIKLFFPTDAPTVDGKIIEVKNWAREVRNSYAKDVDFDDAFNSVSNFAKFAGQEISNQIPILASLAIPYAGPSLIFASSFGGRYSDMIEANRNPLNPDKYSQTDMWSQSTGFATADLVFEKLTTLPLIRSAQKAFLNSPSKNQLYGDAMKDYFKKNSFKSLVYEPVSESASEGMTTITQNLISGENLLEGLDHSMFSGLMMGTTLSSAPFVKGVYASSFSDFETKKEVRDRISEMRELQDLNTRIQLDIKSSGTSDLGTMEDVKENEDRIKELNDLNVEAYKNIDSKLKTLSADATKEFINLSNRLEVLRLEAKKVKDNKSLPEKTKESKLVSIKQEFDAVNDALESFKTSDTFVNQWSLYRANKSNKKDVDGLLDKAKQKLIKDGVINPTDNVIEDEARILYNTRFIKEDLKNTSNKDLNKVVAHDTVEETIDYLVKDAEAKIKKLDKNSTEVDNVKEDLNEAVQEVQAGANGFMHVDSNGDNVSIVNIHNSAKNDRLETRTHELKHALFINALSSDPKAFKGLSDEVLNWSKQNNSDVYKRIIARAERRSDGSLLEDEVVAVFFEEVAAGNVNLKAKKNSTFSGLLGYLTGEGSKNSKGVNINLAGEKDAIKFLVSVANKIKDGSLSIKDVEGLSANELIKRKKQTDKSKTKFSKDVQPEVDDLGAPMGWDNETWKSGGAAFALSEMQNNKMFDGLIAAKLKVPMSYSDTQEFIQKVYAELTSHVNNFKPESNDSLFGWVNSQIANKAGNVYNREYKATEESRAVDIDATTSEGAPIVQIEADTDAEMQRIDEIGLSETEVEERSRLRREIRLDDKMINTIKDAVVKTFGTKLPEVESKKFRAALEKAFRTELKKPIQDLMGGRSDYDLFLRNHSKAIFKALPVETLVQMERNLKPEQRIFTESRRITKPVEVDKLISEGKLPKDTNRLSGPQLHTKKSFPGVEKMMAFYRGKNMESLLGYKVGGSTLGTRKDKLAMEMGVELAFDATSEVLQQPDVQDKRKGILELQGLEQLENELAIVAKQINRNPNVKFSGKNANFRLALGIKNSNKGLFIAKFDEALSQLREDEALLTDHKSVKLVLDNVYGKLIPSEELLKSAKNIVSYTKDYVGIKAKLPGKVDIDLTLNQFILENVESAVLEKSIMQLLSSKLPKGVTSAAGLFRDASRLYRNRAAFKQFLNWAKENKGWSDAKIFRLLETQYKGMYASAYPKNFELVNGKPVLIEEFALKNRGQVFLGVDDFYNYLGVDRSKFSDVNTKTFAETSKAAVADRDYNGRLKQAVEAREAVQAIVEFYNNSIVEGSLDYADLAMLTKMFGSNMSSPMKRAANLAYIGVGVDKIPSDKLGREAEYEHIVPTNVKILDLIKSYINDGGVRDGFWNDYEVAVIPKAMDKVLIAKGLRDFLPIDYKEGDSNLKRYFNRQTLGSENLVALQSLNPKDKGKIIGEDFIKASSLILSSDLDIKGQQLVGRTMIKYSKPKGMSTFDFDETLIIDGKNFIIAKKDGETVKISSGDWPLRGPEFAEQGYEFDFSDFVNVRGGVDGPLLQKMKNQVEKYGPDNVFVLTARMQEAAKPIHEWLKSKGVNIPLENITGLGKSQGEAKGEWMLQKYAEGYNDMYFVDDALPNVKAVKQVLDALDIKSKVVQARIKFSKNASREFNEMLERTKGVDADTTFDAVEATLRGAKKGKFAFFIPPSAEDFKGLMYKFLGKGKQGDADLKWFGENLFKPFSKGIRELDSVKQAMTEEYTALKKAYPDVVRSLNNKVGGTEFTVDNAIRVFLWDKAGFEIPGISDKNKSMLLNYVNSNENVAQFASILGGISRRPDGYIKPKEYWITQSIASDLVDVVTKVNRAEYLAEWIENKNLVFSKENLNKIESIYGSKYRDALEAILFRMETGTNRPVGNDRTVNNFLNWINGSVGAVMFFNSRSAVLQTLSTVNFLNFEDNNIFAAAKAFANQKQFWKDFATIYNSDMLKQRRAGLKIDVSASELTEAFAQGKNKAQAAIAYLLQLGFTPTQVADSFAISMGGSTYYRNRVNKYLKEGKSQKEAEDQAFLDFQEIAEETQQSSRPDLISQQQASTLGRLILAWANTPMQMTRLTKKALSDIVNGRGDFKANMSRVIYYGVAQNIIFGTLQTALMFTLFGSDEEDEKATEEKKKKELRVANGVMDTLLRGTGVYGAAVATIKNTLMKWNEERQKPYGRKDLSKITQEIINLSPPIGTKVRKIMSAIKTYDYNKDVMKKMDHGINNPKWNVFANIIEATTNAPAARLLNKANNLKEAANTNNELWQRIGLALGWDKWSLGVKDTELEEAKKEVKEERKQESKDKAKKKREEKKKQKDKEDKAKGIKKVRCRAKKSDGRRCKNLTTNKNKRCYAHQ